MRLLNTESLHFEDCFGWPPKYAILSHRWGDEEVTLQDFRKGKKHGGQGQAKIRQCCSLASRRGYQWVWIDTCCIDKKSSAELSEAINSMYNWYRDAGECYAYLSDVVWDPQDIRGSKKAFMRSLWFTRGWTLQELLAPSSVIFLDRNWRSFGTEETLSTEISAATGIKHEHLSDRSGDQFGVSIATKMSWLSRRRTSRMEDQAYCMLGLFDVNMPLLYGEGTKAFMRLQLEIIKKSDDESIFAWTTTLTTSNPPAFGIGMLAPWPTCFVQSGDIILQPYLQKKRFPYQMTNQGLEFEAPHEGPITRAGEQYDLPDSTLTLALNCCREDAKGVPRSVTITLRRQGNSWQRIEHDRLRLSACVGDSVSLARPGGGLFKTTAVVYVPQAGL